MSRVADLLSGCLFGVALCLVVQAHPFGHGEAEGDEKTGGSGPVKVAPSLPTDELWEAICEVESHHDPKAWNEAEQSAGIAQIRPICVRDCNRIVGEERWTLEDRWCPVKSREMFVTYTEHYARHYGLGSLEARARIWNGGPMGWKEESILRYWGKVRKALERRR